MKRLRRVAALTGVAAGVVLAWAPAASAVPVTPGATALSMPAYTGTATLQANLSLTGSIGGLLDGLISPIISQDLNPLVSALQGLALSNLVAGTLGASSSLTAGTPSQQSTPAPATFPLDPQPSPCGPTYGTPCYSGSSGLSPTLGPLASVGLSLVSGYTQQVATSADANNPIFGRARVASPTVAVLPAISSLANPVVSAGVIDAKANCPNNGTAPTADASATNVRMLNGLVAFNVASGDIANLTVNGVAYASVASLPAITVGSVKVQPFGASAIKISVPLSVSDLLGSVGLSTSAVTALLNFSPTSSITLNVIAGPNTDTTSTSAKAWGIGVGVDLSGSLNFNLLGLVGATVAVPTGISNGNYGNMLDLRLAYASCTSGSNVTTTAPPVPPALV